MTLDAFLSLVISRRGLRLLAHGCFAASMTWAGQNPADRENTANAAAAHREPPPKPKELPPEWDRKPLTQEEMKRYGLILAEVFRNVSPGRQREFFAELDRLRSMSSGERQRRLRSTEFKKSYSSIERRLLSKYLAATSRKKA